MLWFNLSLTLGVIFTSFIFGYFRSPSPLFLPDSLKNLARYPQNPDLHLQAAATYFKSHDYLKVEKELELFDFLTNLNSANQSEVLGSNSEAVYLRNEIVDLPNIIHTKIYYWEKVLQDKPDYQEAWVQLLYLYYNYGDRKQAKRIKEKLIQDLPGFVKSLPAELVLL